MINGYFSRLTTLENLLMKKTDATEYLSELLL